MTNKELDIIACKTFVCPKLIQIDEKSKELNLTESMTELAKDIAIRYFKKTYHKPHYASSNNLLPACIYIASIVEGDKISQKNIAGVFKVSCMTIRKWTKDIINTLDIKTTREKTLLEYSLDKKTTREKTLREYSLDKDRDGLDKDMIEKRIDTLGNKLNLNDITIKKAKKLTFRYFNEVPCNPKYIKKLLASILYLASIIENDKRTQFEICNVSGVAECIISQWYQKILKNLGLKIISHNDHVICVLENKNKA